MCARSLPNRMGFQCTCIVQLQRKKAPHLLSLLHILARELIFDGREYPKSQGWRSRDNDCICSKCIATSNQTPPSNDNMIAMGKLTS